MSRGHLLSLGWHGAEAAVAVAAGVVAGSVALVGFGAESLIEAGWWWWTDPFVASAIGAVTLREAHKAWRGESCGCC
ncbi:MAG TPA: hypothetical protein VFH80_29885 [Solirubrobacteraceae bacterium]|nr:hypothetical protein [Solirubrobacteraceae bacterium]